MHCVQRSDGDSNELRHGVGSCAKFKLWGANKINQLALVDGAQDFCVYKTVRSTLHASSDKSLDGCTSEFKYSVVDDVGVLELFQPDKDYRRCLTMTLNWFAQSDMDFTEGSCSTPTVNVLLVGDGGSTVHIPMTGKAYE